jgi:hypothetical protein
LILDLLILTHYSQAAYRPRDPLSQSYAPSLNNNIYATSSYAHLNLFESIEANSGTTNSSKEQRNLSTSKTIELSGKSEGNDLHNIKVGACEVAVRLRDLKLKFVTNSVFD